MGDLIIYHQLSPQADIHNKLEKNSFDFISGYTVPINLQIQGFWHILLEVMTRTWGQNEVVYCLPPNLNFNTCYCICGVRNLPNWPFGKYWSASQTWHQSCIMTSIGPRQFAFIATIWLHWYKYKYTILHVKIFPQLKSLLFSSNFKRS